MLPFSAAQASPQPLEVEIVGRDWWEPLLLLVGPLAIALGALGGVGLTVYFAHRRHREQLAQSARLHREQLQNDRLIRHREHVRQVLDSVIENVQALIDELHELDQEIAGAEARRSEILETTTATAAESESSNRLARLEAGISSQLAGVHDSVARGWSDSIRLRVRLGDHEVAAAHEAFVTAATERVDNVADHRDDGGLRNRSPAELESDQAAMAAITEAFAGFFVACEHWEHEHQMEPGEGGR